MSFWSDAQERATNWCLRHPKVTDGLITTGMIAAAYAPLLVSGGQPSMIATVLQVTSSVGTGLFANYVQAALDNIQGAEDEDAAVQQLAIMLWEEAARNQQLRDELLLVLEQLNPAQVLEAAKLPDEVLQRLLKAVGTELRELRAEQSVTGQMILMQLNTLERKVAGISTDIATMLPLLKETHRAVTQPAREGVSRPFIGVPPVPVRFAGRGEMITALRSWLVDKAASADGVPSIVAVDGKPGVGKTSLAAVLASDATVYKSFDGVLWATLNEQHDLETTLDLWALGLQVDLGDKRTSENSIRKLQAALQGRRFLIVIDDVWPQTERDLVLLRQISTPTTVHLVTTRHEDIARKFAGERMIKLAELSDKDARLLLISYCPVIEEVATAELLRLTRAVGNLPLALALVGGYMAANITFPIQAGSVVNLLTRTEAWLGLTDSEHPLSLDEVIGRSVDALIAGGDGEAYATFLSMAAFAAKPNYFSMPAACVVGNKGLETITPLARLMRGNLVEYSKDDDRLVGGGFTLHQTIAAVAYKRAAATGELAAATDRHTTFYLGLLRMQQQEWHTLVAEWPQVRHAWQVVSAGSDREKIVGYALAAVLVQLKLGLYSEMLVWCRRGLEVEDLDDYHRGSLLNFAGRAAYAMGDKRTALHYYQQAMAVLEVAGDLSGQATMFNNLGLTYADGGEYDLAVKNYELAATMHHEGGNRDGEATALNNLASIAFQRSDQATAHAYWEQALELSKEANNLDLQAQILNNIGSLYQAARQFQLAAQNYQAALTIYEATGNQADAALPQHNLAVLQAIVTGGTESRAELEQILAGYQARGDRSNQALALHNLAYYHSWQGERKLAFRLHNEALTIRRSLADPAAEADSLSSIGKLYADGDEHKQAILHYKEALRIRTRLGRLNDQALTLHNMSLSQYKLGEKLEALKNLQRASSLAKKGNNVALQGSIFNALGMVVDSQHRPSVAMRYYNQALILVREVDDQKEEAAILFNQGKVYFDSRNLDEAGLCFRAALTLAEKFNLTFLIESAKDGLGQIAKAQPSQELYAPASLTRKDQHNLLNSQFVQP